MFWHLPPIGNDVFCLCGPYYAVPHGWAECTNPHGCVFNGINLFLRYN